MARYSKKLSNNDDNNNNDKEYTYYCGNELDDGLMCSWPPRYYTCNFCKRGFKSAQALGGHMNVHRKDRAKFLMTRHHSQQQSPSPSDDKYRYSLVTLNTNPNPNPNISSSLAPPPPPPSSSRKIFSHHSSGTGGSHEIMRKYWGKDVVIPRLKSSNAAKDSFYMQDKEFVRLDLAIGLFKESKQDLDLELRLGYT